MGTDLEGRQIGSTAGEQLLRLAVEVFWSQVGGDELDRRDLVIADLAHVTLNEPFGARIVLDGATRTQ